MNNKSILRSQKSMIYLDYRIHGIIILYKKRSKRYQPWPINGHLVPYHRILRHAVSREKNVFRRKNVLLFLSFGSQSFILFYFRWL